MRIEVTAQVYDALRFIYTTQKVEVYSMLAIDKDEFDKSGRLIVYDYFIPEQECAPSSTEPLPGTRVAFMDSQESPEEWAFVDWHTHPNFVANPSATDHRDLKNFTEETNSFYVKMIFGSDGLRAHIGLLLKGGAYITTEMDVRVNYDDLYDTNAPSHYKLNDILSDSINRITYSSSYSRGNPYTLLGDEDEDEDALGVLESYLNDDGSIIVHKSLFRLHQWNEFKEWARQSETTKGFAAKGYVTLAELRSLLSEEQLEDYAWHLVSARVPVAH